MMRNGDEHVPPHSREYADQARHGLPPSCKWEGIAQDEHPSGGIFDESPLRRPKPYVRTRGSPAFVALDWLPPTCVASRGDGHRGDMGDHAGGWGSAERLQKCAEHSAQCVATTLENSSEFAGRLAAALRQVSDVELEQAHIKLEELCDHVSRGFVALVNSGVAPSRSS